MLTEREMLTELSRGRQLAEMILASTQKPRTLFYCVECGGYPETLTMAQTCPECGSHKIVTDDSFARDDDGA